MEGIIVRVKLEGQLVREYKFPSNLDRTWDRSKDEAS